VTGLLELQEKEEEEGRAFLVLVLVLAVCGAEVSCWKRCSSLLRSSEAETELEARREFSSEIRAEGERGEPGVRGEAPAEADMGGALWRETALDEDEEEKEAAVTGTRPRAGDAEAILAPDPAAFFAPPPLVLRRADFTRNGGEAP
jgi:hypothetical protein